MPLEFLTDAQVAGYGRFEGVPSRADLERFFVLDEVDKELIGDRQGEHNRLGLMLQATTVRYVGRFLEDPLDVPWQPPLIHRWQNPAKSCDADAADGPHHQPCTGRAQRWAAAHRRQSR